MARNKKNISFQTYLFTHCILADPSIVIYVEQVHLPFYGCRFYSVFDGKSCSKANTVDPDQMPHYVASDLGLHCLPMALLQVSRLEWVNVFSSETFPVQNLKCFIASLRHRDMYKEIK